LAQHLDLDMYLEWLAFNSLVENSDYLDEVFFYQRRDAGGRVGPLRVAAWDYDDLFKKASHSKRAFSDSLLWACEAGFDRRIRDEPVLRARYEAVLSRLLNQQLTDEHLTRVLMEVRGTLDALDAGLPAEVLATQKQLRDAELKEFERRLHERRQELLRRLADVTRNTAPPTRGSLTPPGAGS
jgi:hypothetical protein